jgi:coenzyme F420-reducing hydrogenase gamma subunit
MVANGQNCMGPVTQAGCGALCPAFARGCFACFGPKETPNTASLASWFEQMGTSKDDIVRVFRSFNASAESFRKQSELYEE